MKVNLLFPGQGSQYVGMGKVLEGKESFQLLKKADDVLGYKLSKIMLEGPEEELKLTQNTQPAILTYSIALYQEVKKILQDQGIEVDHVMGHSVGEYAALVAAGTLSFEDALLLVHNRGKFMQEAVPASEGAMYALLKVPEDIVEKACQISSRPGYVVMPANFNDPDQIVISGHNGACEDAVKWISENYELPHRAIALQVSAPFHSTLMKPASEKLAEIFEKVTFKPNSIPYIANIDSKVYVAGTPESTIRENLLNQVAGSVLWYQSFRKLQDESKCLEIGPGKVLFGLGRKINKSIKILPLDKENALTEMETFLKG
ncbi:MAG: ACP S-malonyltransferase [Bdellovibrionales bacterium]|nr:ACP S-malonyltransferase [Bdellovibrionales bacterium]